MPRILGLIIIFLFGLGLAAWVAKRAERARDAQPERTYRPRRRSKPFQQQATENALSPFFMKRADAQAVSDAFTGAAINTQEKVWRCMGCHSMYHEASITALRKELGRNCMNCDSADQRVVHFDAPN
jgi:hypothetical protein